MSRERLCDFLSRSVVGNSQRGILEVAFLALLLSWPILSYTQSNPQPIAKIGARRANPDTKMYPPAEAQELDGAFWRTDGGFQATISITNILQTASIQVVPVLIMADGFEYPLPPVELPAVGVTTISINNALSGAPPSVSAHDARFGTSALRFSWPWVSAITAEIRNVDVQRSLVDSNPFQPSMGTNAKLRTNRTISARSSVSGRQVPLDRSPKSVAIEGFWWKHDPNIAGFVALSNRSEAQIPVALNLNALGQRHEFKDTLLLLPHQTQRIDLKQILANFGDAATNGGIRIDYHGVQGSILVDGGLENEAIGYSAKIPFGYAPGPDAELVSWSVASVGIMQGPPDPMMLFPEGTRFASYAMLRNISAQPMTVKPTLYVTPGRQSGTSAFVNRKINLPLQTLKPGEVRSLDLTGVLASDGLKDVTASLTLSLDVGGTAGGLLATVGSLDQSGNYVFEVPPHPVSASLSKGICFFEVGNGTDTMVSLWNNSGQDQDLLITIFFKDGHYKLPVHLAAKQSAMFNMLEIIRAHSPDIDGSVIPASITRGNMVLSGARNETDVINVNLNAAIFNVRDATCSNLNCQQCDGFNNMFIDPESLALSAGVSSSLESWGTYDNGQQYSIDSDWSSSDTSVVTVLGGSVSAVGDGSVDVTAIANIPTPGYACGSLLDANGNPESCPLMSSVQSSTPVTVQTPFASRIVKDVTNTALAQGQSPCPAGFGGWLRVVNKIVTDTKGKDIVQGSQALSEVVTIGLNQLNIGSVATKSATTDATTGQFQDTFTLCSTFCPGSTRESDLVQSISDVFNTQTYNLVPNTIKMTCSGITVNNQ